MKDARSYLTRLARVDTRGDDAEAVLDDQRSWLSPATVERARERAKELLEREDREPVTPDLLADLDLLFGERAHEAVALLKEHGEDAELNVAQAEAAEAIVEVDGSRPTLRISDDGTIHKHEVEALRDWKDDAEEFSDQISRVASAVGRIDLNGEHCGTGFMISENRILTNRHVLQLLATEVQPGTWRFEGAATVVFDAAPSESRARSHAIKPHVAVCGPTTIPTNGLDLSLLDFAVLECEPSDNLPEPLPLEEDADKVTVDRPIYTIGYPGRPRFGTYRFEILDRLFGDRYGVKRFAPGLIDDGIGTLPGDINEITLGHDATTLGGSSGGCLVDFGNDGLLVVGLHFGGGRETRNYAHSVARLAPSLTKVDIDWREF